MLLTIFLLFATIDGSLLFPTTLLNTPVPCVSTTDCSLHYNYSWCEAAGVVCIHRSCRLVPGYPCKSTQHCVENEKRCVEKRCTSDAECDNGRYCDGIEICRVSICTIDDTQANCLYSAGECDEVNKQCKELKTQLAWRTSLFTLADSGGITTTTTTTTNTSIITQSQVNITALAIIATVIGALFLFALVYTVTRSIRKLYRQRRY